MNTRFYKDSFQICSEPGSSVNIMTGYGKGERCSIPDRREGLFLYPLRRTGSGTRTMGSGGSFPGGKVRPWRDADHSLPSSVEVKSGAIPSLPPGAFHGWQRVTFTLFYFKFVTLPLYRNDTSDTMFYIRPRG
jgi:hypothetical protein